MVQKTNKTWYELSAEAELQQEANLKHFLLLNALMFMIDAAFLDWYMDRDARAATAIVEEMQSPAGQEAYSKAKEIAEKVETNEADPQEKAIFDQASDTIDQMRSEKAETDQISPGTLVQGILTHEGLLPRQLPVRITSPAMRNWNTYLGFELDRGPKPKGRENFLFLKRQEDLVPAITKQFIRYRDKPGLFGLPDIPTLRDAIKKFDQDRPEGKMKYLKQKFPSIDFNAPLSKYF